MQKTPMWVRPDTPYDFKLQLDLGAQRMTVWVSGRGDDDWYLLAEDAPLINAVTEINHLTVEQCPGVASIHDLMIQSEPWAPAEKMRSHPLAKQDRVVGPDRGFKFQPMRSIWRLPERHVAVARKSRFHHGFPDVAIAGSNHLVAAWRNGSHTGGTGGISVAHSYDLGRTWSEPTLVYPGGSNCPRLQRLQDGTLLLMVDVGRKTVLYDSLDSGHTWINERWLNPQQVGGQAAIVPGRVTELPDGSWLLGSAWYPGPGEPQGDPYKGTEGCRLEFFRSTDRGQTWEFLSYLQPYPPPEGAKRSFHSISEPSILVLPDGKLLLYARENRHDGFPGIKAYSTDNCKTWEVKELPFAVTGRTCAGFLPDGRVMLTFRSGIGRCALWAFLGDPHDTTPFCAAGSHFNDHYTVALKDGALHIDNDGMRGQFTQYFLRQPDSTDTVIDVTVEVKVVKNSGRAATLSVPFVGKFRLFFDHIELAHEPSVRADVSPGEFHTYRVVRQVGAAKLYIDGQIALETDKVDTRTKPLAWTPTDSSIYTLSFGNEADSSGPNIYPHQIPPEVTGYSIWRRFELLLDAPNTEQLVTSWSAERDGFPDQYQLDHIIEIEATIAGGDQGYSGWIVLDDGRIFIVAYTDDTAPTVKGSTLGITWIRGTYLLPSDLPPAITKNNGGNKK